MWMHHRTAQRIALYPVFIVGHGMNNVNRRASKYRTNTAQAAGNCKERVAIIHLEQNKNKP
jgi:hypothetical protein